MGVSIGLDMVSIEISISTPKKSQSQPSRFSRPSRLIFFGRRDQDLDRDHVETNRDPQPYNFDQVKFDQVINPQYCSFNIFFYYEEFLGSICQSLLFISLSVSVLKLTFNRRKSSIIFNFYAKLGIELVNQSIENFLNE